jgi:hypothetical protein
VAGELPHYSQWIRRQRCASCGGPGPCEPHHAESGTTYDPTGPVPSKSAGPRRGKSQRSHDYFLIPLHSKCHVAHFHGHAGPFEGWTRQQRDDWEGQQVAAHRDRYEAEGRPGAPKAAAPKPSSAQPAFAGETASTPVLRERRRIVAFLRREAAQSHRTPDAAAALNDCADVIQGDAGT